MITLSQLWRQNVFSRGTGPNPRIFVPNQSPRAVGVPSPLGEFAAAQQHFGGPAAQIDRQGYAVPGVAG